MIYFDFSNLYKEEYSKRLANFSFYKFLDQNDYSIDTFIDLLTKIDNFSIVKSGLDYYFIRVKEYGLFIKGSFDITGDNGYFKVKDIIELDVNKVLDFEKEYNFKIGIYNDNRNCVSDLKLIKSIIKDTVNLVDYKVLDFINNWDDYLEFERRFFKEKLGFYKSEGYSLKEVYQVKRDFENLDKYKDDIYFDDLNNYLYVNRASEANKYFVIEFYVRIDKSEESYSKLHYFINQEIEIANEKEALIDNKLASKKELEFEFKTTRLGSILSSLTLDSEDSNSRVYKFSKFYNEEENYYFNLNQIREYIENNYGVNPLLVNILSGDISLYKRGKDALNKLKRGDVYNPYIVSYLFDIHNSESSKELVSKEGLEFSNKYLDEYQKEAIFSAINSNSIYLLQGPPGTGKTQTISELVYQFNKMGKRVVLSSQTHVAIDNVLERLPNELNVLPIRLVSSERKSKVDSLYLPNNVVDNFTNKLKSKYEDKLNSLNKRQEELEKLEKEFSKVNKFYNSNKSRREKYFAYLNSINALNKEVLNYDSEIAYLNNKINKDKLVIKFIGDFKSNDYRVGEYIDNGFLTSYIVGFEELKNKYNLDKYLDELEFNMYLKCFNRIFKDNVLFNNEFSRLMERNIQNITLKHREYLEIINNEERALFINKEKKQYKVSEINKINTKIKEEFKDVIDVFNSMDEFYDLMFNKVMFASRIPDLEKEKIECIKEYLEEYKKEIDKELIEYNLYNDIYKNTLNYLNEDNLKLNKERYTRYLVSNNIGVYALTCNANSKYLKDRNRYLSEYNLNDIDLNNIDFDVVIIDEVSKASAIELLIPILYGKSVILVGDHRQLPPLFKYKEGMFEGLTLDKRVSREVLDKYELLVETSLFKKLFSEAKNNKYMLIKQYRSHKQIMDIVNLFYEDKLVMGNKKEQNNLKEHNLEVSGNGLKLFTKDVHTYFVDSTYNKDGTISYEKKLVKGGNISSSFYNDSEIEITKNLLIKINEGYENHIEKNVSVGVISLYKDQVNMIKKEVNKMNFKNINFNKSKVSSVDEFQGKEEDIIIVNLVRNSKSKGVSEFVKKLERINVALSRARKMLIVVGAKSFFTRLDIEMESLDDSTLRYTKKLYNEIYNRMEGKIKDPYSYF